MTTWTQATTAETTAEIRTANLALAESLGVDVTGWDDFSPDRATFEIEARALKAEQDIRVLLAYSGFLETAALAGDTFFDQAITWFDEVRIPALATVWTLRVSCPSSAGPYTIAGGSKSLIAAADDGTLFQSSNESNVTIPSGSTVSISFTCMTAGVIGNQNPGNITHLVVGLPGLAVTNNSPAAIVTAGRAIETTQAATTRVKGKWGTLGAGWTRASFDYLIPRATPTVTRWLIQTDNPVGAGTIRVVQATAAGPSSDGENATTRAALTASDVQALGSGGLFVISATSLIVAVSGTLFGDGTNPNLLANAKSALDVLSGYFPIGGDAQGQLSRELLIAVLMGGSWPATAPLTITSPGGQVATIVLPGFTGALNLTLATPAADVDFATTEVMTITYAGLVLG